mmetsp:Transcript_14128/g.39533  ORF Transcript_14128/g.39533 Transcript_14128/m.39533 type:complete len:89 (-) Transcript_14128:2114-2380(-)
MMPRNSLGRRIKQKAGTKCVIFDACLNNVVAIMMNEHNGKDEHHGLQKCNVPQNLQVEDWKVQSLVFHIFNQRREHDRSFWDGISSLS